MILPVSVRLEPPAGGGRRSFLRQTIDEHPDEAIEVHVVLDRHLFRALAALPDLRTADRYTVVDAVVDVDIHVELLGFDERRIDQRSDGQLVVHVAAARWRSL